MLITPLGDSAIVVELGNRVHESVHRQVQEALAKLEKAAIPAVTELVPAYTTVTLFYDPIAAVAAGAPAEGIAPWLAVRARAALASSAAGSVRAGRELVIPVVYGGEFGPDLAEVAERTGLTPEKVSARHAATEFLVYLLGFSPGFAYMGGLPAELAVPRRTVPRTAVPPGSVGIVNDQTCIYPQATPGGWNLIGRTPWPLFDPAQNPPARLRAGDRIRFRAIKAEEFSREEGKSWA